MSTTYVPVALRRLVEERAGQRCEYRLLLASVAFFPHEVDHVIAEKHGGATDETNLALSCWRCNRHKGTDLGSFDPLNGGFAFLYNPRKSQWATHFSYSEGFLVGLTAEGRTTVRLLQLNNATRVVERQRLIALGQYMVPTDSGV